MMTSRKNLPEFVCALVGLLCLASSSLAAEPDGSPSPAPSSPVAIEQPLSDLSAQRAAAERTKIYRAGASYSHWLDDLARESGNLFLRRQVFGRVTWMRLLSCAVPLAFLALLSGWFLWTVRRHAGQIESKQSQSGPALFAAAIAKPLALFVWIIGGVYGLMPIVTGLDSRPMRLFLAGALTAVLYAGEIVTLLWLILRGIRAIEKRLRLWADRTDSVLGKVVVPVFGQTLRLTVPLLGVILLLPLLKLPQDWTWVTQKGFGILLILGPSFLIVRGVGTVQQALLSRHRIDTADNLSARRIYTQVSVIRKIIVAVVVIVSVGSILMLFDPVRQFGTSILASAGIAGIVLGFAAQKTLGNILAGVQIALTQPLLIDDVVLVEGEYGQIEEITLTYVTVRTWDLRRLILPITYFIERPFQNWTRVSTDLLGTVIFTWIIKRPWAICARN